MGGPGIVFSREALRRLGPKLGMCLHNLMTEHEDVELGRCVHMAVGIGCTNSWEANQYFYQNFKRPEDIGEDGIGYLRNIDKVEPKVLAKALSLHANKDMEYQYGLHSKIKKSRIDRLQLVNAKLEKEIKRMNELLEEIGDVSKHQKPKEVIQFEENNEPHLWIQVQRGHIYRYSREDMCNRKVEEPWVDVISNSVRDAAKQVYKEQHLMGKVTKIEVPLLYHTTASDGAHYRVVF